MFNSPSPSKRMANTYIRFVDSPIHLDQKLLNGSRYHLRRFCLRWKGTHGTKKWMKPSKKTKTLGMIRRQCKPPFFVNEAKHCKSTEIATESPDVLYKRDSNDLAC